MESKAKSEARASIIIEGREVKVVIDYDLESFPSPALAFFCADSGMSDPLAEMAGWKNPVAAFRQIAATARELCASQGLAEVSFAPYCEKRARIYLRALKRIGAQVRTFRWDCGDLCVVAKI